MGALASYRGSGDAFVYGITSVVVVILLFIAVRCFWRAWYITPLLPQIGMWAVGLLCLGILLGAWAFAPSGYAVSAVSVIIRRPVGGVEIPLASIREVQPFEGSLRQGAVRTFGTGGLFGVYGRYYNEQLGHYHMYGTRTDRAVVITTEDRTVVVTPDDIEGFVRDISGRLGSAGAS